MVLMETYFLLFKYPLVSGLWSLWYSSYREVPLQDLNAALSYFLLSRDARNCCPIKIIIAVAEAGVASWIHQRPKNLLLAPGCTSVFGPREWLEWLVSWHRSSLETYGFTHRFSISFPHKTTHICLSARGHTAYIDYCWSQGWLLRVRKDLHLGLW